MSVDTLAASTLLRDLRALARVFVTFVEAAELLRCSTSYVRARAAAGVFPTVWIRGRVGLLVGDLPRVLDDHAPSCGEETLRRELRGRDLLTLRDLIALTGISDRTWRRLFYDGDGPPVVQNAGRPRRDNRRPNTTVRVRASVFIDYLLRRSNRPYRGDGPGRWPSAGAEA